MAAICGNELEVLAFEASMDQIVKKLLPVGFAFTGAELIIDDLPCSIPFDAIGYEHQSPSIAQRAILNPYTIEEQIQKLILDSSQSTHTPYLNCARKNHCDSCVSARYAHRD